MLSSNVNSFRSVKYLNKHCQRLIDFVKYTLTIARRMGSIFLSFGTCYEANIKQVFSSEMHKENSNSFCLLNDFVK